MSTIKTSLWFKTITYGIIFSSEEYKRGCLLVTHSYVSYQSCRVEGVLSRVQDIPLWYQGTRYGVNCSVEYNIQFNLIVRSDYRLSICQGYKTQDMISLQRIEGARHDTLEHVDGTRHDWISACRGYENVTAIDQINVRHTETGGDGVLSLQPFALRHT